jgi:hypothetical protein
MCHKVLPVPLPALGCAIAALLPFFWFLLGGGVGGAIFSKGVLQVSIM